MRVQTAHALVGSGDCADAAPLLERAVQEYTDDGNVWGLLGACRAKLSAWHEAVTAFEKALELGVRPWDLDLDLNPNDIMVRIAATYAQAGDATRALAWLRRGLEARYDERPELIKAPEFANLRNDSEFGVQFAQLVGQPEPLIPGRNERGRDEPSRDEQWRRDIAFLREQVGMLHFDPDHHTSAAELERMLTDLVTHVPNLSDEQITARLVRFIGALGAGHDVFSPVGGMRGTLLPFALKVFMFSDGLYIIDAYDSNLIGARIDSFDNTPTADAYAAIARAFPGDNEMEARWQAARHFMQAYTLEALGSIRDASAVKLTITDAAGIQRTIIPERRAFTPSSPALTTPPNMAAPLYLSRLKERHWLQRLDKLGAVYVQINSIANDEDESLEAFVNRVGEEYADARVRNVILDLRHSPGGNGYLTPHLLRKLIHFDASPDKDNLYVIIGRNTFSASHNLIVDLDRIAEPIFVGEPSGSRPNAISESGRVRLPYSQFDVMISSQLHQHSFPEDHRLWIAPDVPVSLSSEDFFSGRDPALEAIEALIANKRAVVGQ
jgi:tetratricopeptide (TPR) repeat protein